MRSALRNRSSCSCPSVQMVLVIKIPQEISESRSSFSAQCESPLGTVRGQQPLLCFPHPNPSPPMPQGLSSPSSSLTHLWAQPEASACRNLWAPGYRDEGAVGEDHITPSSSAWGRLVSPQSPKTVLQWRLSWEGEIKSWVWDFFFFFGIAFSLGYTTWKCVKSFFFLNWSRIALQFCVHFCCTTWISYKHRYVPSLLNLPSSQFPSHLSRS